MPPPRHRDQGDFHRNRSSSPFHRKRSWLSSSSSSHERSHHSPPSKRKDFKLPQRPYHHSSSSFSQSRSPKHEKRDAGNCEGPLRHSSKDGFKSRSPIRGGKPSFGSSQDSRSGRRSRSLSPVGSSKERHNSINERVHDRKLKRASRSPDYRGVSSKKKSRQSSQKKNYDDRSISPNSPSYPSSISKKHDSLRRSSEKDRDSSLPQRKVSTSMNKKKTSRLTLHSRFTDEDLEPFQLQMKDNVTIAILRNPRAEPSDDVTVQRIFDSSLFKMVHKKTAGRKPIFDREEIKVWKHDENFEDDFEERRLVRVKASHKRPADSSLRMSPDALRKSLGNKDRSASRSPHRSPNVRLIPQPDSRYESRYQQQIKRDEIKRKEGFDGGRRGRGGRDDEEEMGKSSRDGKQSRGDDYDLRHALERRKSGRDEDFERGNREFSDPRKHQSHDDRNVIVDHDRARRFEDVCDREREGREFDLERKGWGRGRGRGPRHKWSPRRTNQDNRGDFNSGKGFGRRDRYSTSPFNNRGRGSAFHGRGRGRDQAWYEKEDRNSPPADFYNKYLQHDDRDISPRNVQGSRGHGGQFSSGRGFRGTRGWSFGSGRGRGFRTRGRGRGYFGRGNSRSMEREDRRSIDHASDREWKHDLYDTVQSDDELPHSTTVNN